MPEKASNLETVHRLRMYSSERYDGSWLEPGCPTAHMDIHLVLLPSGPDTVHESMLRRTQLSTLLTAGRLHKSNPQHGFDPAIADCRLQDTATSPSSTVKLQYELTMLV